MTDKKFRLERRSRSGVPHDDALTAARARDERGFAALFALLAPSIAAFAHSRGSEDPDGIANGALFAAFSSIDTFTGSFGDFRSFVFRIARNHIVDEYRARRRMPTLVELDELREHTNSSDDFVQRTEDRDHALRLIKNLTDSQQEVLLLRTVAGLSVAETAAAIGSTVNATKQLQLRAVRSAARENQSESAGSAT